MKRQINGKTYSKTIGIKKGSLLAAGKDGDIEEYKADATDVGKVLTVGEDGSIAPAESGGEGKIYYNHLLVITTNNNLIPIYCSIILSIGEQLTIETLKAMLTEKGYNSDTTMLACGNIANIFSQSGDEVTCYLPLGMYISNNVIYFKVAKIGTTTSGVGRVNTTGASTIIDTVIEL